jgi:hypothetical protein
LFYGHIVSTESESRQDEGMAKPMILVRGQSLGRMSASEVKQFIDWAKEAQNRTTFDLSIIGYPRCAMLITEDAKGPLAYLPVQTTIMAECFIPRPDSTNMQRAASLGKIDDSLVKIAKQMNVGDVYTFIPDSEPDYANKVQRHGWVEIPWVRLFKKHTGVTLGRPE